METIFIEIYWSDKNYCCGWGYKDVGVIMCTNKTLDGLKQEFEETLRFHIEAMVEDGEVVPQWLVDGDYNIKYTLATSAMLRQAEQFTTMAAISRATGINQRLLSNYASDVKKPRPAQREKIIAGIHAIGQNMLGLF